ncbi:MAG: hypothetical protein MUF51_04350, partial [Vicinamibacteria bacterium]|nr:hypothetical protein [Vicinamibacteria bacterium]
RYECREPSLYHRGTCLEGLVRHVEVQAVWYNALLIAAHMASQWGDAVRAMQWNALAARVRDSFLRTFWDEELGYLADCVAVDGARDMSLRPYQLYALGLPHALLPREPSLRILAAIEHALLTPCGLRTLAPKDPRYRGRCVGSPAEREEAAQNGAAWPSLAGVYFDAQIRLHGEQGKRSAREWLRAFCDRVEETGLGQVCEYFDGDTPQRPQGVVAHALGTAELLRLSSRLAGKPPVLSGRERHT